MGERSDADEEDIAEFISRSHIDEAAAAALKSLPVDQQLEVIAGSITRAANPSAVLLSRIKRVKLGMRNRKRPHSPAGDVMPPVPPPCDADHNSAVEQFLEHHGINAEACQSLWELSPALQRLVILEPLPESANAYDALLERITEVLAASPPEEAAAAAPDSDAVTDFLKNNNISGEVASILRKLPEEQQNAVVATPLTGAQKPSAVLLSRINRIKSGHGVSDLDLFLQTYPFDGDARRSFLELRADLQRQLMIEDFSMCRNPSAYLMSRVRYIKDTEAQVQERKGRAWPTPPPQPPPPQPPQPPQPPPPPPPLSGNDILETFLSRHGIDAGGREALRQLPAELQLAVLAHDHDIGEGGRNPSQHLVSLIGMAWAGTLKPPQASDHEAHEAFLGRSGIDDAARQAFFELPTNLQKVVIDEGPILHCWNPSAVLHSRIGRARAMWKSEAFTKPPPQMAPRSLLPVPLVKHPPLQALEAGPAVVCSPIPPIRSPFSGAPPDGPNPFGGCLAGSTGALTDSAIPRPFAKGHSDFGDVKDAKKRKADDEDGQLDLAVEGFLRLNGIDGKSCRAMRRLPRSEQRALIGMDLRHRRNPSAALWMQIQKMREESKEESREDGNDRSDPWPPGGPQPTRAASLAKLPPPPPPPPAKPPAKAKENGPVALAHLAVKLESLEQGKPNHEPKEGGAVAFVLFRHGGGASVPEFVEVLDHLHALTCGRASSSDILIKVQHASKKHAEFRVEHGPNGEALLMFCDLSSNGTWLNGDRLPSGRLTRLLSGDIIFFMPPGSSDDVPALQVEEQRTKSQEESLAALCKREVPPSQQEVPQLSATPAQTGLEVSDWIRSIGSGGKLCNRLISEIESSYDHIRQIIDNYSENIGDFLDVHCVNDREEAEVLSAALRALCSWEKRVP